MIRRYGTVHCASEWGYSSGQAYADPFNEVTLDLLFAAPDGQELRVPAYWAGGQEWRVRFAPAAAGQYTFRTDCSDTSNPDLHNQQGVLEVAPYSGKNKLFEHGPLQVSADKHHFQHADGTPFFWLGDTWWMGFTKRFRWPEDFQLLTADRVEKGFSVVQIVAGLYPDMPAYDPRGYNEAGHPWEPEYARLNPAYFDAADVRIQWLVRQGIVPCVVGCWAYHLPWLGMEKMKQHWRNIIARWGAYPVVWCLAGEGAMPFYLAEDKAAARAEQISGWTEMARFVRETDPYHRLITIHPTDTSRTQVEDPTVLDFDMLQTGHGGVQSFPNMVKRVAASVQGDPTMPVVNGEPSYEGILESSREEVQRFNFWSNILLGAAGFTYGGNGIWQFNAEDQPYGPSPHGASWGDTPWTVAYRLPGSGQIGMAKRFLERYPYWQLESHPEWIEPHATPDEKPSGPYAAGVPGVVRIHYLYHPIFPWAGQRVFLKQLEPSATYRAFWLDPRSGAEYPLPDVQAPDGQWEVPVPRTMGDWVLILENK